MSDSESGEDNFEDAVESVEVSVSPASRAKRNTMKRGAVPGAAAAVEKQLSPEIEDQIEILTGDQLAERDTRWRRLEQLRMRRATGDNTAGMGPGAGQESPGQESPLNVTASTPADSRESSVEGIYLSGVRSHHPFKVVECDTRSVASDGKSVRTGDSHRSSVSDVRPCAAPPPDIVSSVVRHAPAPAPAPAKPAPVPSSPVTPAPAPAVMGPPSQPLAPPRKKKVSTSSSASPGPDTTDPIPAPKISSVGTKPKPTSLAVESLAVPHPIPSPASTVASLTKDLESQLLKSPGSSAQDDRLSLHNLNISSATRGDFVVRPQDEESRRGEQERKVSASEAPDINQDPSGGAAAAGEEEEAGVGAGSGRGSGGKSRRKEAGYLSGGSGSFHSGGSGGYHSSRSQVASGRGSGESRKSVAGSGGSSSMDSGMMKQMNMFIRTKSDSGNRLTDQEILKQIKVKNLDDGGEMDLVTAEDLIPKYTNPLSQHIMRSGLSLCSPVRC